MLFAYRKEKVNLGFGLGFADFTRRNISIDFLKIYKKQINVTDVTDMFFVSA